MIAEDVHAWERVRISIIRRKDELGITNRAFAKELSYQLGVDVTEQWVSNLLSHKQPTSLRLRDLDAVARILKTTPARLVKADYEQAEYLTPTEYRVIEAMRGLPPAVRDHFLLLAEYLMGVVPDEIEMLRKFRELTGDRKDAVRHSIDVFHMSRTPPPDRAIAPDVPETSGRPTDAEHRTRTRAGQRRRKGEREKRKQSQA